MESCICVAMLRCVISVRDLDEACVYVVMTSLPSGKFVLGIVVRLSEVVNGIYSMPSFVCVGGGGFVVIVYRGGKCLN